MNYRLPASHSMKHNMGVPMSLTKTMEIMKKRLDTEGGEVKVDGGDATVSKA
jgi:hypothetical protein